MEPVLIHPATPAAELRRLEILTEREHIANEALEADIEHQWNTCCLRSGKTDARLLRYICTMTIITGSIIFSLAMLGKTHGDCNSSQIWLGLLTLLIGSVLPAPSIKK